jgi:hypothetical protein
VVAVVRWLREVQARGGQGEVSGERCLEMLPCPLSWQARAAAPVRESSPEVNRVLAGRLLGLLVERMARATGGGSGDERGEHHGEAAPGAG